MKKEKNYSLKKTIRKRLSSNYYFYTIFLEVEELSIEEIEASNSLISRLTKNRVVEVIRRIVLNYLYNYNYSLNFFRIKLEEVK